MNDPFNECFIIASDFKVQQSICKGEKKKKREQSMNEHQKNTREWIA